MAGQAKVKRATTSTASASKQIDKLIAKTRDWRGKRLAEIRKLIHEVDPDVVEDWKWMGTPCWSHDGMYLIANPHKDKVKLTFFHGAKLPDPKRLFNAGLGGGKWRAIDFREGDKVNKTALKALLRAAVKFNATHKRASAKPRLLSGGNPQIAKGDGDAPVQAYIAAAPGWKGEAAKRLDALIVRTVPDVRKAVKWNSPFYGIAGQGWFMSFHCMTKYVKVAFFFGAKLDPLPPVESSDKNVRYFHVHEEEAIDDALVASWIRQAAAIPGWLT